MSITKLFRNAVKRSGLSTANFPLVLPWHRWILDNGEFEVASAILDMGCGDGTLARRIIKRATDSTELIGMDHSAAYLTQAEQRSNTPREQRIQWMTGGWGHVLYPDQSFDRIVFEFLPGKPVELHLLFSEMARLLQQDGRALILIQGRRTSAVSRAAHHIWNQMQQYRRFSGLPSRMIPESVPTTSEIVCQLRNEFTPQNSSHWIGGYVEGILMLKHAVHPEILPHMGP